MTVKPVIDLPGIAPVDRYEVPDRMSEAIGLMHPADYFPHGSCLSRHQDNDHTIPYSPINKGGPPGWTVRQVQPGAWLWRTPHGHHYLVDQTGTTALGQL